MAFVVGSRGTLMQCGEHSGSGLGAPGAFMGVRVYRKRWGSLTTCRPLRRIDNGLRSPHCTHAVGGAHQQLSCSPLPPPQTAAML